MAGEDRAYSDWIRQQPCCMCGAPGPSEQHHKSGAGMGLRAHDWYSMPLCRSCHHEKLGEMEKSERRKFEFDMCLQMRTRYRSARPELVAREVYVKKPVEDTF